MEFKITLTGAERKELVAAVGEITGHVAVYQKAPTFAYVVGGCVIDKNGTIAFDEGADAREIRDTLKELAERGFTPEDPVDMAVPGTGIPRADNAEEASDGTVLDRLVIEVPMECFTETALLNLEKLVASKAALIRKVVHADALPIERTGDRLCFPWFTLGSSQGEILAYTQFVTALCEMAKKQRRVIAKEKPADSEKFAFRCFLLRLGFIGDEYAAARKILLANLPGDGSFKRGKRKDQGECSDSAFEAANAADNGMGCEDASWVCEGDPVANDSEHAPVEGMTDSCSLAEALADAELVYNVNRLFEKEGADNE